MLRLFLRVWCCANIAVPPVKTNPKPVSVSADTSPRRTSGETSTLMGNSSTNLVQRQLHNDTP